MLRNSDRETVDQLIKHFWQNGYLTISRRHGTYLPPPSPVGNYSVDAIGRYNKKYAIGIILSTEDIEDSRTPAKLSFLATRQTRYSNKKVSLFVGVDAADLQKTKELVSKLNEDARRNIKLVILDPQSSANSGSESRKSFRLNLQ